MRVEVYEGVFGFSNCHPASTLTKTFADYKKNGSFWSFGRDVPYLQPPKMNEYKVRHIHLIRKSAYESYQNRRTRVHDRVSDKVLIYAKSPIDNNHFLLIAILDPDAHVTAQNHNFMHEIYDICKSHFG